MGAYCCGYLLLTTPSVVYNILYMSTITDFLIKKAELTQDLAGVGAGASLGGLTGLLVGSKILNEQLKPHTEFINTVAKADREASDKFMRMSQPANAGLLVDYINRFDKDLYNATMDLADYNVPNGKFLENVRLLQKYPNLNAEAKEDAEHIISNHLATWRKNKDSQLRLVASKLKVPQEYLDALLAVRKSDKNLTRVKRILSKAYNRVGRIGMLAGLLGGGAGYGASKLVDWISDKLD